MLWPTRMGSAAASGILRYRQHLVGPAFQMDTSFAPAAVAVAAQVRRDDVVVL